MAGAQNKIPKAVWEGSFNALGIDVKVVMLEDSQRIIDADSFHRLVDAMENYSPDKGIDNGLASLMAWQSGLKIT